MPLNTEHRIDSFKLLGDSLSQVAPVYVPLLILVSPSILINIAGTILPKSLLFAISLIYIFVVAPILGGIMTSFIHDYLKQSTIDLNKAVKNALGSSVQLIVGMILYFLAVIFGSILLLIPGIYLSVKWAFCLYPVVLNKCSAMDGFKYSSRLVRGRWWSVFGSMLLSILLGIPIFVSTMIFSIIFLGQPLIAEIANSIVSVLITPLLAIYYIKLYFRLEEIAELQNRA